jgi:DNA-binding XRE family transcriptional regulator
MEGRSSPRVKVRNIPATIRRKSFAISLGKPEPAKVIDMGPKGLSLRCDCHLETDCRLALIVIIPDKRTIKCSGIVRNVRKSGKGYIVGIEFKRLSNQDREYLTEHILEIAEIDVLQTCRMLKDRVRGLRTALELTVSELSDLSGVPHQRIVEIEFGMDKSPPEEILESLASGLGVSTEDLMGDEPLTEDELLAEVRSSRYAAS